MTNELFETCGAGRKIGYRNISSSTPQCSAISSIDGDMVDPMRLVGLAVDMPLTVTACNRCFTRRQESKRKCDLSISNADNFVPQKDYAPITFRMIINESNEWILQLAKRNDLECEIVGRSGSRYSDSMNGEEKIVPAVSILYAFKDANGDGGADMRQFLYTLYPEVHDHEA